MVVDASGKLAPAGEYAVFIEAAHEHGTYGLIRQKTTVGPAGFRYQPEGNLEIKSATIEFMKKASGTDPK